MSILNIFKRKKEPIANEAKNQFPAEQVLAESNESVPNVAPEKKIGKAVWGVITRPHVTEKSANAGAENKYIFVVSAGSNKHLVKSAVEARYGVSVKKVAVLVMPEKKRMRGRQIGWRPGFKKAVVTLKEGQSIEIQ